jgi:ankyrin repeat protein
MKSKEQYLFEYESILKQTGTTQQKLNELNTRKQQLQYQSNSADQILSINQQVGTLSIQLEQLNKQSAIYKNELSALTYNDSNLKQRISNLESQYQTTLEAINTYDQAFTDIMVILNGFSAKEGLELNQAQVLIKILSPEELIHTDVLKKACEMNHKEEFDKAIAKITDINFQDKDGKTILMHAISNGFYYGVDKLLARGADVNLLDNKGANALIYCAELPHIKYIKIIAEMTADLNHKAAGYGNVDALHLLIPNGNKVLFASELNGELNGTSDQSSLLITDENYTIKNGWTGDIIIGNCTLTIESDVSLGVTSNNSSSYEKTLRITEFLISRGMNINSQNDQGLTPFFLACDQGLSHLARELLKQYGDKIDFSLKDIPDNTYLHYASRLPDSTDIVELILNKIDVNAKNTGGGTAALQAAMRNNVEILALLIKNNADISILDIEGRHLWHYASQYNAIDSMKFLKDKIPSIIDLRTINPMSVTALHTASELGHLTLAKWLVEEQADINAQTGQLGLTPFFLACRKKNFDMAEYLFNHSRFNNGVIDTSGFSSLHWALELKDIAILQKILNKGIDIDYKTANGDQYTALWLAAQQGHLEIVKWLISKQADVNAVRESDGRTALQAAICNKNLSVVQELVEHAADVNKINHKQFTPLYHAVELEDLKIIKLLIDHGANVTAAGNSGDQPIHMAAFLSNILIMKILFDHGASINATSNIGNTLLHEVLWEGSKANPVAKLNAVKYLLTKSANPQTVNNEGKTAIDLAKTDFQEALPWLEHPENLLPLHQFESDLIGNFSYSEL